MITVSEILVIHQSVLTIHGGASGIRDLGGLESALARPYQTFGGAYLYPSCFEQAATIGESIIVNHPFVDGNKRTGYVLMETLLRVGNIKITATNESLYNFIISISTGNINFEQIVDWLKSNTTTF